MDISKLQPYSVGVVAVNKKLDSHVIEVTPTETMPMLNGELTDNQADYKAAGKDEAGGAYEVEMKTTATLKATWLPIHMSNRITSPNVRRGALVMLYRFADSDEYFWTTLKDDLHLRKLETVVYAWSATKVEGAPVNADNYYFLEVSTHTGLIHLHTSKANGEPFVYDIQLNTKDGTFLLTDDIKNYIGLDSKNRQIEMKNADGSIVEVNKQNINLECEGTITLKGSKIVEQSIEHSITNETMNIAAGTMNGNAGGGDLVIGGISHTGHTHDEQGDGMPVSPPK